MRTPRRRTRRPRHSWPSAGSGRPAAPGPRRCRSRWRSRPPSSFCVSISVGDFPIPLVDVVSSLVGHGNPESDFIIRTLRLPRALTGLLVGAAFGLSGAIFQSLARNPLASPDIIGDHRGRVDCRGRHHRPGRRRHRDLSRSGAFAGSLLTAALDLPARVQERRVVATGSCWWASASARCSTPSPSYLLTRAEIYDAQRATVWLTGSLNGRGWEHVRPVAITMVVLVPATLLLARPLRALQLGDDTAKGLGVRVEWSRVGADRGGRRPRRRRDRVRRAGRVRGLRRAADRPAAGAGAAHHRARRPWWGRCSSCCPISSPAGRSRRPSCRSGSSPGSSAAPYLLWLLARANKIGRGG